MKISFFYPTLAFLLISVQVLHAQIVDNFTDGDFDQNPTWSGDALNFKINTAGELQLNAIAPGQSSLFVEGNIPDSSIWDFDVLLTFDPSSQNLVRIYLQSDQTDLALANGYYLEMGETGSADAINFYRQDGSTKTLLASGQPGLAAMSPKLHCRAKRSVSGDWTLEAGAIGSALQPQFALTEHTWPGGTVRFFGVQCVYTISNATKFFFDNINIRPDVPDTQPPVLVAAIADDATQVSVEFDEDLETVSAEDPANYSINNGIGQPLSATLSADNKTVVLTLLNPLSTGAYTLQTSGVKDVSGNTSLAQTTDFQFVKIEKASEFDILITEIMADPSPIAGLPDVEWFEILNRSSKIIDLSTIRFSDATSAPIAMPVYLLQAGEHLAITALPKAAELQAATSGSVLGVAFSTSLLNNDSDVLTLSDLAGDVIDRVPYQVQWHTDPGKEDGGFSLERINTALPCHGSENWQSCPATIGGTPAAQNAANAIFPDESAPHLIKAYPESASSILLAFSEGMDRSTAQDAAAYQLNPNIAVASALLLSPDRSLVRLSLASPLQPSTVYSISIQSSVEDCSGNMFEFTDTVFFGLSEKPAFQDIVINEILSNPESGGSRYIEFYNRSQKIFDWSEFFLVSNSGMNTSLVQIQNERLFLPGDYHVFSNDAAYVRDHYANIINKNVLQNSLPSLDDHADSIKIYWASGGQSVTVDSFYYWRGLHNGLLSTSELEGVALERIRTNETTQSASNWTSASTLKTGAAGTPTLSNSQSRTDTNSVGGLISIPIARLSPDGDDREDFLEIFYDLPKEGYAGSLNIFDSDGNMIKNLIRQNLIGTHGSIRWDGDTDAGEGVKARPGIHLLYFEVFSPDGEVIRLKKTVALLGKF